jgi:hypothetical protein
MSEKKRLETFVNRFEDSNEEYLKIKQKLQQMANSIVTTEHRILLRLAVAAVMEAFRNNGPNDNNNNDDDNVQHLLTSYNIPRVLEVAGR